MENKVICPNCWHEQEVNVEDRVMDNLIVCERCEWEFYLSDVLES